MKKKKTRTRTEPGTPVFKQAKEREDKTKNHLNPASPTRKVSQLQCQPTDGVIKEEVEAENLATSFR
jgi:hypothetical protein